jgi:hypothetical protein
MVLPVHATGCLRTTRCSCTARGAAAEPWAGSSPPSRVAPGDRCSKSTTAGWDAPRRAVWDGLPEAVRRERRSAMWPIKPVRCVGYAATAALLFQNRTRDTMVRCADALRCQRPGSERRTILWYEAGHGLEHQAFRDQAEWPRTTVGIAGFRMAFLVLDLRRRHRAHRGARLWWLLTTAILGPLGVIAFCIPTRPAPASPRQRAIGTAALTVAANASGAVVALAFLWSVVPELGRRSIARIVVAVLATFGTS